MSNKQEQLLREEIQQLLDNTTVTLQFQVGNIPIPKVGTVTTTDAIISLITKHTEQSIVDYRDEASTRGRPLSAEPLIIKQPVPCTGCKATHYADWTLWPHQVYNSVLAGGIGHYCFDCFCRLRVEQLEAQKQQLNSDEE